MTTQQAVQVLIVLVVVGSLIVTARYWRVHPDQWSYTIPPLSWLLHLLIFYGCIFARDFLFLPVGLDFTLWSAVVRLQASFLIFGVMAMLAFEKLFFKT